MTPTCPECERLEGVILVNQEVIRDLNNQVLVLRRSLAISLACEDSLCEQLMHLDDANHELEASNASTLEVLRAVEWIRQANPLDRNGRR